LRLLISAAILLVGVAASQAADDLSCLASPTRACVLTMAVDAIEPAVIQSAADAGQFDLVKSFVSHFDKSYDGVDAARSSSR
jgi:hypothetical protein